MAAESWNYLLRVSLFSVELHAATPQQHRLNKRKRNQRQVEFVLHDLLHASAQQMLLQNWKAE